MADDVPAWLPCSEKAGPEPVAGPARGTACGVAFLLIRLIEINAGCHVAAQARIRSLLF